ncbi:hypothetical protein SAMN04489722_10171 [Algibacter lectus]|uniref:hypothetical protein n=1 Tax=Algibacter lectus TaxID=221126 RepID=UPI0008E760CC|nr:hypothetical protein [Algibacter lectus]SFB84109.1 hypothetical protein SAMN04489722_10171 [Algibacter lectus]
MEKKEIKNIKDEWILDLSALSKNEIELLHEYYLGNINFSKSEGFDKIIIKVHNQKKEYYANKEIDRRQKISKGIIDSDTIDKQEICAKTHLVNKLIKYNYNETYINSYSHAINLEYLVRLRKFIYLKDGGYLNENLSNIRKFKDIIEDFRRAIDIDVINEYEKTKLAPEKFIYPLIMSEYLT